MLDELLLDSHAVCVALHQNNGSRPSRTTSSTSVQLHEGKEITDTGLAWFSCAANRSTREISLTGYKAHAEQI